MQIASRATRFNFGGWSPMGLEYLPYIYHKIEAKYKGNYSNPIEHLGFCWVNF